MPLLVLGFFVLQLDRSNIGNALADTITTDLGITTDDVNLGYQHMLAGIVISELPSNMLLQKSERLSGSPVRWAFGVPSRSSKHGSQTRAHSSPPDFF